MSGLLFLVMFTYAVMGVALFGDAPRQNFLSDRANFENFQTALLTLFRVGTGESWNAIMRDLMVSRLDSRVVVAFYCCVLVEPIRPV